MQTMKYFGSVPPSENRSGLDLRSMSSGAESLPPGDCAARPPIPLRPQIGISVMWSQPPGRKGTESSPLTNTDPFVLVRNDPWNAQLIGCWFLIWRSLAGGQAWAAWRNEGRERKDSGLNLFP
jgi:hypothetical protein